MIRKYVAQTEVKAQGQSQGHGQAKMEFTLESPPSPVNRVPSPGHVLEEVCSAHVTPLLKAFPGSPLPKGRSVLEALSGQAALLAPRAAHLNAISSRKPSLAAAHVSATLSHEALTELKLQAPNHPVILFPESP